MTFAARAEEALRRNGGRITASRRSLLRLIEESPRPKEREPRCHHAIVCTGCGRAREFHSVALERALAGVRRNTRYRVLGHLLELRGLCRSCQA